MKDNSKAMVLTGPEQMEMQDFNLPSLGDEEGLLKVELAGVCGSDIGIFRGIETFGPRPYPLIMGHEIVGRIAKIGFAAKEHHGVKEGDRVVIEYAFGCGRCGPCRSGSYRICDNHFNYGSMMSCIDPPHLYGAYSEYLYIHPNSKVHYIGENISPESGVLICAVLANGIRWMRDIGGVSEGDTVVILGPGPQGIAGIIGAKEAKAGRIIVLGLKEDKSRLDLARKFGCDEIIIADEQDPVELIEKTTAGRMANVVMDVTGNPVAAPIALSLAGYKGTFVMPGLYKHRTVQLDLDIAVTREIKMLGAFSHDSNAVKKAIKIVESGRYPFDDLISHRYPLEDAEQAVRLVAGEIKGERPMKVVLDLN